LCSYWPCSAAWLYATELMIVISTWGHYHDKVTASRTFSPSSSANTGRLRTRYEPFLKSQVWNLHGNRALRHSLPTLSVPVLKVDAGDGGWIVEGGWQIVVTRGRWKLSGFILWLPGTHAFGIGNLEDSQNHSHQTVLVAAIKSESNPVQPWNHVTIW